MTPLASAATLVVMVAPPGAGKTTWIGPRFMSTQIVSLDELRAELTNDAGDQSATPLAVSLMHQILDERMRRNLTTVVDATNARRGIREAVVGHAWAHGRRTAAVVLDVSVATCLERNTWRRRQVPESVIRAMHLRIQSDRPGLVDEFDAVVTVGEGVVGVVGDLSPEVARLMLLPQAIGPWDVTECEAP